VSAERLQRREFLKASAVGIGGVAFQPPGRVPQDRGQTQPNLLFVFADQFRRQALGFMAQDPVKTPSLDRFSEQGFVSTNAVSSVPVCTPFRGMLMTGRYPLSTGLVSNAQAGSRIEMNVEEECIADVLRDAGYQNGYIGKWHLDMPTRNRMKDPPDDPISDWDGWTPPGPRRHGFDFWYAYNCNSSHFDPIYWKDCPGKIQINEWSVKHETDIAIEFLRKRDPSRPFALFMSWNPPHNPYVAPEEFLELYEGKQLDPRANVVMSEDFKKRQLPYYAAVSSCDYHFGRLLKALDELGLSEDTVVVFTADHGEMLGSHGRWAKTVWYEESVGIPFMLRWPGRVTPRRSDAPWAVYHFMPSLLSLLKVPIPSRVEGTDYSQFVKGESNEAPPSAFIASFPGGHGEILAKGQDPTPWVYEAARLRKEGHDWRKLGYRGLRTRRYTYVVERRPNQVERLLYDNEKDPFQLHPIRSETAPANPLMRELENELAKTLKRMNDPFPL
jgi:arylsulfatase A-like enzyme